MFVRTQVIRILNGSSRLRRYNRSICKLEGTCVENGISKINQAIPTYYRCYSSSKETYENSSQDVVKSTEDRSEDTEVLDLEEERYKLRSSESSKYDVFKDDESPIILDVEEERLLLRTKISEPTIQQSEWEGVCLERGICGVFDTEELVSVLKQNGADNVVVIKIPQDLGYADHMIIVSGRSSRHLLAMATYVRRLFKQKMSKHDRIPKIEGKRNKSDDWLALDLGNIILHFFSKSTRKVYDLESLWTLGPEFDPHLNKTEDDLSALISKHSLNLDDLQPAGSK